MSQFPSELLVASSAKTAEVLDAAARLMEAAKGTGAEQPVADFIRFLLKPRISVRAE